MTPNVLVVTLSDAVANVLDLLLVGRANVMWAPNPDDCEGRDVIAVVVVAPCGEVELKQISVHPGLRGTPVALLGTSRGMREDRVRMIDTRDSGAIDDITEWLSSLIAMAAHPARGPSQVGLSTVA